MANIVLAILRDYNLEQKFFCITSDNASNNDTMVDHLQSGLATMNVKWDGRTNHIRCFAHILQLVVNAGLDELRTIDGKRFAELLQKVSGFAKFVRRSPQRFEAFRKACESLSIRAITIPLPVKTRWSSDFRMMQATLYLRKAINRFIDDWQSDRYQDISEYRLTNAEWAMMEVLHMILLPFQRCTKRFETNGEIDYVFFAYDTMFEYLKDVLAALKKRELGRILSQSQLINAVNHMIDKLKEYYILTKQSEKVFTDAMILNPRC
jgi:hypothetical protein